MGIRPALLVVLCALAASCGGGGKDEFSADDNAFVALAGDASGQAGAALQSVNQCLDSACAKRQAVAARAAIDAQIRRTEQALDAVDSDCVRSTGHTFVAAFEAERATISDRALSNDDAGLAADDVALAQLKRARHQLDDCVHTPAERVVATDVAEAFSDGLQRVTRCRDDACLVRGGRRLGAEARAQRKLVAAAAEHGSACMRKAQIPLDAAIDAWQRLATDFEQKRPDDGATEAQQASIQFAESGRVLRGCST